MFWGAQGIFLEVLTGGGGAAEMRRLDAVTLYLNLAANLQSRVRVNIWIDWYILLSSPWLFVRLSDDDVFVKDVSSLLHVEAGLKLVRDIIMENFRVVFGFRRNNWCRLPREGIILSCRLRIFVFLVEIANAHMEVFTLHRKFISLMLPWIITFSKVALK